jgi:hypothetical protein
MFRVLSRPGLPYGFIEPCLPTRADAVPAGPHWIHEIKHDGYRMISRRKGGRLRIFTRRGHDWSDRVLNTCPRYFSRSGVVQYRTDVRGWEVQCGASPTVADTGRWRVRDRMLPPVFGGVSYVPN